MCPPAPTPQRISCQTLAVCRRRSCREPKGLSSLSVCFDPTPPHRLVDCPTGPNWQNCVAPMTLPSGPDVSCTLCSTKRARTACSGAAGVQTGAVCPALTIPLRCCCCCRSQRQSVHVSTQEWWSLPRPRPRLRHRRPPLPCPLLRAPLPPRRPPLPLPLSSLCPLPLPLALLPPPPPPRLRPRLSSSSSHKSLLRAASNPAAAAAAARAWA